MAAQRDATKHSIAEGGPPWLFLLRALTLMVAAGGAVLFGYVVVQRFRFPVEVEWMGGAVLDHVERVRSGLPLYAPPSAAFVPFIYPPLYYDVCAIAARALPLFFACRTVSVLATLAIAALLYRVSRLLSASRFWSLVAVGLFFWAYSYVGYWYDLERCDSLFVALLMAGALGAMAVPGVAGAALGGALLGLAFFAKQPAVFVLGGGAAVLLAVRGWRRAAALGGAGALVIAVGTALLDRANEGWFSTYVFDLPARHGIHAPLVTLFLIVDTTEAFALFAATLGLLACAFRSASVSLADPAAASSVYRLRLYVGFLIGAFVASAISRWHVGGWRNVLMFWSTFACPAFAVVTAHLERGVGRASAGRVAGGACLVALLQMGRFGYTPDEASPDAGRVRDAASIAATVARLEQDGEVIVAGRGHLTHPRHAHIAALIDLLRAGRELPPDLTDGLRRRRYAAIVLDELQELSLERVLDGRRSPLFELVAGNYFVARRLDDREPAPVIGFHAHPSWILRPRRRPLLLDVSGLERRQRLERGIAEERMRFAQAGMDAGDGRDIEDLAAAIDESREHDVTGPAASLAR